MSFSSSYFSSLQGVFCSSVFLYLFGSFYLPTVSLLFAFSSSAFPHSIPSSFLFCFERHSLCFFCFSAFLHCVTPQVQFSYFTVGFAFYSSPYTHTLPLCLQVLRKSSKFPSRDPFLQFLQSQPNFAFFQFYFCFRYFYLLIIASCRFFILSSESSFCLSLLISTIALHKQLSIITFLPSFLFSYHCHKREDYHTKRLSV